MRRHDLVARAIATSVPILNLFRRPRPWPYGLEELATMPEDSWGRELHRFLSSRGLDYLPKYEEHDALHALLGYGTTVTEELRLQAFMLGNRSATVAGRVLLTIGVAAFPAKWGLLRAEYRRGRRSVPLRGWVPEELLPRSLPSVRNRYGIA